VTFSNPPTFLPPVLATGQGQSANGRQQLGSGLVTHRGIIDTNSLRVQGYLNPQSGAGLEIIYTQPAPKNGILQSYDRDAAVYTDLTLSARNITLSANGGGKVSLPAGTAQNTTTTRIIQTWNIPAINGWYESPLQLNQATTAGNLVRIEGCGTIAHSVATATVFVGCGVDGTLVYDSLVVCQPTLNGAMVPWSFTCYIGGQITTSGTHRFAVFLYTPSSGTAGFSAAGYQLINVTEQRA
jgi:hypothetical protein